MMNRKENQMAYESFLDNARAVRATERLEQMNRERSLFIELIEQYGVLCDNYELQPDNHSKKALNDFLARFPNIPNYDSKGNWIGNVRNENGWTA
jgi:hypothetical protein